MTDTPSPRLWQRPPGLVHTGLCGACALVLLWDASNPGGSTFLLAIVALLALVVLAGIWVLRLVAYLVAVSRHVAAGTWWWWLVAPVGGLVFAILLAASVPLHLRWRASEPAFDRRAERLLDDDPTNDGVGRSGLYEVTLAERDDQGRATFTIRSDGFFAVVRFVRVPAGARPPEGSEHLSGRWWFQAIED